MVNLISVDCPNLQKAFRFLHFPWSCPLQIVISLYFLYDILDEAVIPGKSYYCELNEGNYINMSTKNMQGIVDLPLRMFEGWYFMLDLSIVH